MSERYQTTQMISVEDALLTILERVGLLPVEKIEITSSVGRTLAESIVSDIDIAPFDCSAMDGFAVRFDDFATASADEPLTLDIVGVIGAGEVFGHEVKTGQALRIMTGAPLPAGADTVVKIEDTEVLGESDENPYGSQVIFTTQPREGENVQLRGREAHKGDVLLRPGYQIKAGGVGLMASGGRKTVAVYRRPSVAVFSTGSELVDPSEIPGPGQIRNSNSYSLAAAVREAGGIPTILPLVEDTQRAIVDALSIAAQDHDFVVLSGGAAEGDFDYTTSAVRELGEMYFSMVNMKPGKAQTFGVIDSTPVFGLSGNPSAALAGFEILVRPALRKAQGFSALERPLSRAHITTALKKRGPRRQYLTASLRREADDSLTVTPAKNQSSALLGALNESNCLLVVPDAIESLSEGAEVVCMRIDIPEGTVL